jgi:hypothetical protein
MTSSMAGWLMCDTLTELSAALESLAAGFEARAFTKSDLEAAMAHAGAIEKIAAALGALAALQLARLGKASTARREAVRHLAKSAGTSVKVAERALGTAEQMEGQPEVGAAARRGELSRQQAAIVSLAAVSAPGETASLLSKAATSSLSELADEAARAKAAACGPGRWREEVHRARSLRSYTDAGGIWHMHAQGLPEDGARVMAALAPISERLFSEATRQARREPPEAYGFDALVALASSGGGGSAPAEVVFRVDLEAFLRGYPADGEVMEVAGFGPTSAEAVRDVLEHGNPFLKAVITKGRDVVGVAHLGRRPNTHQATALDWMYPTCAVEGCGVRTDWCQADHREPWSDTHFTLLGLLDRLCRGHHRMKTNEGWALVEGKGKRPFVSPSDRRHPSFANRTGAGPPGQTINSSRTLKAIAATRGSIAG